MKRTFDEVVQLIIEMQNRQSPVLRKMRNVLDMYNGDWVLPMPEVDNERVMPALTPALVGEAVDSAAMRASSVRPSVTCAAINPMKDKGVRSREKATLRRRILAATYHSSMWSLGRRRYHRQLSAYHTGSLVVIPDDRSGLPRIEVRDPLGTFAEPLAAEQLRPPAYVAFITRLSHDEVRLRFPQAHSERGGVVPRIAPPESMWEVFEWYDEEQILYGLLGPVEDGSSYSVAWAGRNPRMPLAPPFDNKAGMVPAVVPHNVSLGAIASRIASLLGNVELQAKLTALDILAQEKAIYPDTYIVGRQNALPQIVGNQWRDGRTGDVNLLSDVEQIGVLRTTPDLRTSQTIDRLERNFRVSTGYVPQMGGETYGALRTGRGIDALAGFAVEPRIQEIHEIDEAYLPYLNKAIFATYKGYWGSKQFSLFSGWAGDQGLVEFVPNEDIETDENTVSYPIPGADVIQMTQILGSLNGAGAISRKSFRDKHPWIDDPDGEAARVEEEQLEEALRQSVQQQIASGQLPLEVAVIIHRELAKGVDIFGAVAAADKIIRERQATAAPTPQEGMMAPPEAMPGLAGPPEQIAAQPMAPQPEQAQPMADPNRMRQLMAMMGAG